MALVLNGTTSVVNDCASLLFTDTTGIRSGGNLGGYGTPNPNYTDIASVTFTLIDSSALTVGVATTGWIPNLGTPINDSLYLFPSDFGLSITTFANDTYSLLYTVTLNSGVVYTKTVTGIVVQCPADIVQCPYDYVYYNFVMDTIAGNYASTTTVTSIRVAGVDITSTNTTPITSRAVLLTVLADIIATSGQGNYLTQYTTFVGNGTYGVDMVNFYGVQGGYKIFFNLNGTPTTISCSAANIHTSTAYRNNRIEIGFSCDDKSNIVVQETSGFWDDGVFPDYVDLVFPMQLAFTVDGTNYSYTINQTQFLQFIGDGLTISYQDLTGINTTYPYCVPLTLDPQYVLIQDSQDLGGCYIKEFTLSACGATKTSNLVVKTSVSFGCDCFKFSFCDTTGTYDSILNTTGYGNAATALYADIYNTTLTITSLATGTSITIDNGFIPSEIGVNCFDVTVDDIMSITGSTGLTSIPDTVYKCVYNVYSVCDELLGTSTIYLRFTCNLQNCIDQRGADLVTGCCTTDSAFEKDVLQDMIFNLAMFQNPAIPNNKMDCIAKKIENLSKQCVFGCPTCQ
jgi:hypothetical protein